MHTHLYVFKCIYMKVFYGSLHRHFTPRKRKCTNISNIFKAVRMSPKSMCNCVLFLFVYYGKDQGFITKYIFLSFSQINMNYCILPLSFPASQHVELQSLFFYHQHDSFLAVVKETVMYRKSHHINDILLCMNKLGVTYLTKFYIMFLLASSQLYIERKQQKKRGGGRTLSMPLSTYHTRYLKF